MIRIQPKPPPPPPERPAPEKVYRLWSVFDYIDAQWAGVAPDRAKTRTKTQRTRGRSA